MNCERRRTFVSKKILVSGKLSAIHLHDFYEVGFLPIGGLTDEVLVKCSHRNFHADWKSLSSLGLLTGLPIENMLFVSENGDDATGLRTRLDKPFLTISAAMAVATVNDTVYIFPGTYTIPSGDSFIIPNVNMYCEAGANITIIDMDVNTFSIGGSVGTLPGSGRAYGIFGEGEFFITSATPTLITPTVIDTAQFIFSGKLLYFLNTGITWTNMYELTYKFSKMYVRDSNIFDFDNASTLGYNVLTFKVDYVNVKESGNTGAIRNIRISRIVSGGATIDINWLYVDQNPVGEGFLNCNLNLANAAIKVIVSNAYVRGDDTIDLNERFSPLIFNNDCSAQKDITFSNVDFNGRIMSIGAYAPGPALEKGIIKVRGIINQLGLPGPIVLGTMIDFSKENQQLIFELDIEDKSTVLFQGANAKASLLNISSLDGLQVVKGQIKTTRPDPTDSLIKYGETYENPATVIDFTVTLEDFTIVGDGGFSFEKLNGVTTAEIPSKGVYTNLATEPSFGGVVAILNADGIIVDPGVR